MADGAGKIALAPVAIALTLACLGQTAPPSPSVRLEWKANPANPVTGVRYYPYRAAGECGAQGQVFEKLTESPVEGLTYLDTAVRRGRKYCYRVTAAASGLGESQPSPTANVAIPLE